MSVSLPSSRLLPGMTFIELLATMVILSLLTVLAVPSFRSFQGRQTLTTTQKSIQSLLYRMQQLALAPLDTTDTTYEIIGYGLMAQKGSGETTMTLAGCTIAPTNDFLALVAFARFTSGQISYFLVDADRPTLSGARCNGLPVTPSTYPNAFYTFPSGVVMASQPTSSPTVPWMIAIPLRPTQKTYGDLCQVANCATRDGLKTAATTTINIMHTSIAASAKSRNRLCRRVTFSEDAGIQVSGIVVAGGCS